MNSPGGLALDHEGNLYLADSANNALRLVSKGLNFPAVEITAASPATMHTIFLGLNQSATLSIPTIAAAEIQQGSQAPTQPQEYTVGTVGGCTSDGTTANPSGSICTVPVTFVPGYPGTRTGAMKFTANGIPASLGLYGIGLGPQAVVVPGIIQTILYSTDMFNGTAMTEPERMAVDPAGNVYVADPSSNVVWSLQNRTGASPTIVAGGGALAPAQANGGQAVDAALDQPNAVALDAAGNLYIAETGANLVRKVDLATGIITTVAGNGTAGFAGDGAAAENANLNHPAAVAADGAGNLYIADTGNARVRKLYSQSGMIVTLAGSVLIGDAGDSGPANAAALSTPSGVAVDSLGQVLISDPGNDTVRRLSANTPTLDFGSEAVGAATASQTDFLSNIGNQPLAISQFLAPPIPVDFPPGPECSAMFGGQPGRG